MGVGVGGVTPSEIGQDPQSASSTETLLRNIQSLLKVAADNARQQERQITYEKGKCPFNRSISGSMSMYVFIFFACSASKQFNINY